MNITLSNWNYGQYMYFYFAIPTDDISLFDKYFFIDNCIVDAFYKAGKIFIKFVSYQYQLCDYFVVSADLFDEFLLKYGYFSLLMELDVFRGKEIHLVEEVDWVKEGF